MSYLASATYNAQGQMTQLVNDTGSNGLTRQRVYDPNTLRLTTIRAGTAAPFENLQKLSYAYDNVGNITSLTDAVNGNQVQTFGYDWLDRLTSASTSAAGTGQYADTYAYDAIGNITNNDGNAYTYSASQPHAVTAAFGNTYSYDANGNQTGRTIGGVAYTFDFDYENRLTEVKQGTTTVATFIYDAEGTRVKGTVNGVTTVYIAGVYEYQAGATTSYYEGGALRRSGYASDNGVFYLLRDHLGSSSVLVNRTGVVKKHEYYYPYGGNRGTAFSTLTTKRFTGQYHEQDLPGGEGLSYYNARWYDAQLGRFVSADTLVPDPGDPQALNRLAYTRGNPLRFVDPTGHVLCIDSKCDLTWHPIEQRPKLRTGIAPRAISYIHGEMTRNATSAVSQVIWGFNAAAKLFYHPRYFPVQEPISQATAQFVWASQVLDARLKKYVGPFAPLIGNWDHKPILTNKIDSPVPEIAETGQWSTVGDLQYRFDIWSNIHYGYVGRAANFTGNELINGAGVEQIGSDIYNKNTPSRSSNAPTWRASWDDPSDTAAIQIGIDMWNRYGLTVTTADLYLAVLENPRLTSQPIGGSQ